MIRFEPCHYDPDGDECASPAEVSRYFLDIGDIIVRIAITDQFVDFTDLNDPLRVTLAFPFEGKISYYWDTDVRIRLAQNEVIMKDQSYDIL